MFKSFKKIVSVVAALGLLATSYVTVLAAPTVEISYDMNSQQIGSYVNGSSRGFITPSASNASFVNEVYGKSASDYSLLLPAGSSSWVRHVTSTGASFEIGSTVYLSVDFAMKASAAKLPQLQLQGVIGEKAKNIAVAAFSDYGISVNPEEWHNISIALTINNTQNAGDIVAYLDGTQVGTATPAAVGASRYFFASFTNLSGSGTDMYIDNFEVYVYPPNEAPVVKNSKIEMVDITPHSFTANNGAILSYYNNEGSNVLQLAGQSGKASYVQIQDMNALPNLAQSKRLEFSFDAALSAINDHAHDFWVTLFATPTNSTSNAFRDSGGTQQDYGLNVSNGAVEFYGESTGKTVTAEKWYNFKIVYDLLESTKVYASLYIDNEKVISKQLKTPYAMQMVRQIRFRTNSGNTIYIDNVDIDISNFTVPAVTATATNQTQDGVNYMTWDATPSLDADYSVSDCGFAFINDEEITSGDPIVWQESTKREDGTFGAAIAQDPDATGSSIYAIPYIAGQGFAKLGTAVRSIFNTIGNE